MPFGVFQKGIVKREPLDVKQLFWSVLQDVLKCALMNINKSSGICFFFFFQCNAIDRRNQKAYLFKSLLSQDVNH